MTYDQKVKAVAIAFMRDDPKEYEGDTLEEVIEQLKSCENPGFIDHAYEWFVKPQLVGAPAGGCEG